MDVALGPGKASIFANSGDSLTTQDRRYHSSLEDLEDLSEKNGRPKSANTRSNRCWGSCNPSCKSVPSVAPQKACGVPSCLVCDADLQKDEMQTHTLCRHKES